MGKAVFFPVSISRVTPLIYFLPTTASATMASSYTPQGSPYIASNDLRPPSPLLSHSLVPATAHFDSSPFSVVSDLDYTEFFPAENDNQVGDNYGFSHNSYSPHQYDAPNSSSLLIFEEPEYMINSEDPFSRPYDRRSPYDHSSPSSNAGSNHGADSGPEPDITRSRASSVSSLAHPSPRLQVAQTLESMSFHSPHWNHQPLPPDPTMSPPHKPQSPPQLLIPDTAGASSSGFQGAPSINVPKGEGGLMPSGPQLHIVPATPVSGGGAASQSVPFSKTLQTLHQGNHLPVFVNLRMTNSF